MNLIKKTSKKTAYRIPSQFLSQKSVDSSPNKNFTLIYNFLRYAFHLAEIAATRAAFILYKSGFMQFLNDFLNLLRFTQIILNKNHRAKVL